MDRIKKEFKVGISSDEAFRKFVNEFNEWWPREYTWSQEKLEEIKIEDKKNGLCSEFGPYGFRCDWGRVTEYTENALIGLKWQISAKREPIPNPDKASDINISFTRYYNSTIIKFEHFNFENHGEDSDDYRKMMDSEQGWDHILNKYIKYCEKD